MKRPSKRLSIIIIVSLVCMIGAGLYTWQSLRTWRDFETRLQSEQRDFDTLKKGALSGKTPKERLAAIRALDDKVSKRSELCRVNGAYAWQAAIIPPLKDGVARCNQKLRQLNAVAGPLHEFRQYLDTVEKLQSTVQALNPAEALSESNWGEKGLARAKQVQKDINELTASGDATKLKDTAKSLAGNLVKAWESLIKANEQKDKTAYIAALDSLTKAYADFGGLSDSADTDIKEKAGAFLEASAKL